MSFDHKSSGEHVIRETSITRLTRTRFCQVDIYNYSSRSLARSQEVLWKIACDFEHRGALHTHLANRVLKPSGIFTVNGPSLREQSHVIMKPPSTLSRVPLHDKYGSAARRCRCELRYKKLSIKINTEQFVYKHEISYVANSIECQ